MKYDNAIIEKIAEELNRLAREGNEQLALAEEQDLDIETAEETDLPLVPIEEEITLDAEIENESKEDLTLDAEIAEELASPVFPSRKAWKRYAGKLRMLAKINNELVPQYNALHSAFAESGRYFMEAKPLDYVALWLDVENPRPVIVKTIRRKRKSGMDKLISAMLAMEQAGQM